MKLIHRSVMSCVFVAILLALPGCQFAKIDSIEQGDQVLKKGQVADATVTRGGVARGATVGMELKKGDDFRTGPGVTAFVKFSKSGSVLIVYPNSDINIKNPTIWVRLGRVLAKVRGAFKVETESVEAGVEGTEFFVTRNGEQLTFIMLRGAMRVKSKTNAWPASRLTVQDQWAWSAGKPPKTEKITIEKLNTLIMNVNRVERRIRGNRAELMVPHIIGLDQKAATQKLTDHGLKTGKLIPHLSSNGRGVKIGQIARQSPTPGAPIKAGNRVDLWVEAEPVRLPNLLGTRQAEADASLRRLGLVPQLSGAPTITGRYPSGTVNHQSPAGKKVVPKGSTVQLVIEDVSVRVPNLVGMTEANAIAQLKNLGLYAQTASRTITGKNAVGSVIQHTRSGQNVRKGTTVELTVEAQSVLVPNLTGRHVTQALSIVKSAGLIGRTSRQYSTTATNDYVIGQTPPSGSRVGPGTQVNLVIAIRGVTVPNVYGMRGFDANTLLKRHGLVPKVIYRDPAGVKRINGVIKQSPAAGATVARGTPVTLTSDEYVPR